MFEDEKTGLENARNFLKRGIDSKKVRDALEAFGEEDLLKVVKIAKKLGYNFTEQELATVLKEDWGPDIQYVKAFCLSEPPAF